MTAGQVKWTSAGKEAKETSFKPIPADDYEVILRPGKVEVRSSSEPHDEKHRYAGHQKLPYVGGLRLEVESLTTADGRPRIVFKDLYMHADPDKNGGPSMVDRADGLMGLIEATGNQGVEFTPLVQEETGRTYLDPVEVAEFVKSLDGMRVGCHVDVELGKGEYKGQDKNLVTRFWPLEGAERAEPAQAAEEEEAPSEEPDPEPAPKVPPPRLASVPVKKPVPPPAKKVAPPPPAKKVAGKKR